MRRFGILGACVAALVVGVALTTVEASAKGPTAHVADGARGVWVGRAGEPLKLIDPSLGRTVAEVDVGRELVDVVTGLGYAWTLDADRGALLRVDEARDRVDARAPLGVARVASVAVGKRSVWVTGGRGSGGLREAVLLRVDPRTLEVRGTFHLGRRAPPLLAVGHGAVWLGLHPTGRRPRSGVVAIAEGTGRLRFRRHLRGLPGALARGGGGVWMLSLRRGDGSSRLVHLASDGAVSRGTPAPFAYGALAAAAGRVWVASEDVSPSGPASSLRVAPHDERTGALLAGPFAPSCRRDARARYLSDIVALAEGAAVVVWDDRGGSELVLVGARSGVPRCVPL